MKNLTILFLLVMGVWRCNPEEVEKTQKTPMYGEAGVTNIDSLYLTDFELPEITNYLSFDSATISIFRTLATETDGKMYLAENAELVVETVIEIIENHGGDDVDLCFLIDKTGSMMDDIYMLQSSMKVIFDAINKYKNINVAIVYYGDKNVDGRDWVEIHDFSKDFKVLEKNFMNVMYSGGGDAPESVTDGAYTAVNDLSWSSGVKRIMLVLGDAPSLVPPLADKSVDDVVRQAKEKNINTNYYPVVVGFSGAETGAKKSELIASIYPNPATDIVNILFEEGDKYLLELFNIKGDLILSEEISDVKHQIKVGAFVKGAYVIRVSKLDGSQMDSRKLVVR